MIAGSSEGMSTRAACSSTLGVSKLRYPSLGPKESRRHDQSAEAYGLGLDLDPGFGHALARAPDFSNIHALDLHQALLLRADEVDEWLLMADSCPMA